MGYAWLLRERDGLDTVAARAGALNPQTAWVLKQLKLDPPVLLTDASPRFESVMQRLDSIRPDAQLGMAWTLASRTGGVAPVVGEDGKPYGIINGLSLFKYFTRDARSAARRYNRARNDVCPMQGRRRHDRAKIPRQWTYPRFSQPNPAR